MSIYPDGPPEDRPLPDRVWQEPNRLSGPDYRPLQQSPGLPTPPYLPQVPGIGAPWHEQPFYNFEVKDQPIQPYPTAYIARPTPPAPTSGLGVASLVLGLVGACLVGFGPFGVLALIFGATALPAINRGEKTGKGIAIAGLVLGIVQVTLWAILLIGLGATSPGLR